MPGNDDLTDNEAHDLLHRARVLFEGQTGATVRAETALRSGEKMLGLLMLGLLIASENGTDDPTSPQPLPPKSPDLR